MNLNEFLDEQEGLNQEGFRVTDDSRANWTLRKIKELQEAQATNSNLVAEQVEKLKLYEKTENKNLQDSIDHFTTLLGAYALHKRQADPKYKSQKLPNGRIRFKKQQPKWNYDDEKVVDSLKNAGLLDFIKVKESPSKTDIKKTFDVQNGKVLVPGTGEILSGIEVVDQEDKFEVIPNESD